MTISTLTTKDIQLIYESAVHDEATKSDESGFVLDCVLDDAGGTGATIRKLIDMVRARDAELLAVRDAQAESVASCIVKDGSMIPDGFSEHENSLPDGVHDLYATPPAPAVPGEYEILKQAGGVQIAVKDGVTKNHLYGLGWNACRAAMLENTTPMVKDDTRRMDWLVAHHVEVRKPLLYGSQKMFTAQTLTDEEDDYHATSLREQIDAAMAAAPTTTK